MGKDSIKVPILEMLGEHIAKRTISMHVPGHKNGVILQEDTPSSLKSVFPWDLTELSGLDDLHEPEEGIKEAEALLTRFYQTKKSYFLVNGSTVGNLAMILGSLNKDDAVIVQRNSHKSIMNGLRLAKVKPVFLPPLIDRGTGIPIGVPYETILKSLNEYPDVKAIILTYPNYYGMGTELLSIIKEAHKRDVLVLVDEAHGAHFAAGSPFPQSAISLGADIVVHSAHKTLPAMTMGSYLHINSDLADQQRVEEYLRMLQSSSPSYPIMLSLDLARAFLEGYSDIDKEYLMEQIMLFKQYFWNHDELDILESKDSAIQDPLKLIVYHKNGLSGFELQRLMEKEGVYLELASEKFVLLVLPLLKKGQAFPYGEIIQRLKRINWDSRQGRVSPLLSDLGEDLELPRESSLAISYSTMEKTPRIMIPLSDACGRIAAETIIPYPPGIPLIQMGEIITEDMIGECLSLLKQGAKIQGGIYLGQQQIQVFE